MSPRRRAPRIALPSAPFVPGGGRRPEATFEQRAAAAGVGADELERVAWVHALDLWNGGFPWEAHEAFEVCWRAAPKGSRRRAELRALVQACAALVHLLARRPDRFQRLARRAQAAWLDSAGPASPVDAGFAPELDLRAFAAAWERFAAAPAPDFDARPRLVPEEPA